MIKARSPFSKNVVEIDAINPKAKSSIFSKYIANFLFEVINYYIELAFFICIKIHLNIRKIKLKLNDARANLKIDGT